MKANQNLEILKAALTGVLASNTGPEFLSNKATVDQALIVYKLTLNAIDTDPFLAGSLDESFDPD